MHYNNLGLAFVTFRLCSENEMAYLHFLSANFSLMQFTKFKSCHQSTHRIITFLVPDNFLTLNILIALGIHQSFAVYRTCLDSFYVGFSAGESRFSNTTFAQVMERKQNGGKVGREGRGCFAVTPFLARPICKLRKSTFKRLKTHENT